MISENAEANHLQRDVAYCSPIVQVEYNAWHNAGTNPWIGLVESIFTAIDQWAKEAGVATDVFLQLGTARRLLREYDAQVKARQAVLSQAQEAFAGAEKQFQAAIDRHARALSASKWQAVAAKLGPDWKDNKARDRAGRTLGIEAISLKPELHDKVLKESKTLSGRHRLGDLRLDAPRAFVEDVGDEPDRVVGVERTP